jgi:Flp pilus assembly pilin Flp
MSKLRRESKKTKLQSGFAMIEYVIVSGAIVIALFQGTPSVAVQLVEAVKSFYRALTFFISLP